MTSNRSLVKKIFEDFSEQYFDLYMNVDLYSGALDYLADLTEEGQKQLLDLGCGPANLSYYLDKQIDGLKITGIDLSEKMISLAKQNLPEGKFITSDIMDLPEFNHQFDIILLGFIIPYLSPVETQSLLATLSDLISESGLLYISAIDAKLTSDDKETKPNAFKQYLYGHDDLEQILSKHSFELKKSFSQVQNMDSEIIIVAQKKSAKTLS